jgi:class 3 adenylate cyclase/tetratricopeptide (TPR) repeat protein
MMEKESEERSMRFLVPRLILSQDTTREHNGTFTGAVLYIDMSGFTKLTTALMHHGDEGAETLSGILNGLFEPIIGEIEGAGGFVSTFAGDAATAVFPDISVDSAARVGLKIQRIFDANHLQHTPAGEFPVEARVGLGYGSLEWGTIHGDKRSTYYLRGTGIEEAAAAQERCAAGEVLAAPGAASAAADGVDLETRDDGFSKVSAARDTAGRRNPGAGVDAATGAADNRGADNHNLTEAQKRYIPVDALPVGTDGEFRTVASVFITLGELSDHHQTADTVRPILDLAEEYGGYFNLLDFGDKGPVALILFGAPVAREDDVERGRNFALEASRALGDRGRIGLAQGTVFAGFVGAWSRSTYTALGASVNLASRLATGAEWGQAVTAGEAAERLQQSHNLSEVYRRLYKGFTSELPVYCLTEESTPGSRNEEPFVGRSQPLDELRKAIELMLRGEAPAWYVLGEAGVGKTRLALRAVENFADSATVVHLDVDTILRKSMNPLPRLVRVALSAAGIEAGNTEGFETTDRFISWIESNGATPSQVEELRRSASGLLSLLGSAPSDSLYNRLDPEGRFELVSSAVATLVEALAPIQPVIMIVDNAHALDADSRGILSRIVGSRRTGDTGLATVFVGRGEASASPFGIEATTGDDRIMLLRGLSPEEIRGIVSHIIGGPAGDSLVDFVLRRVGTNALYISELARYLAQHRLLVRTDSGYEVSTEEISLPTGINALLVARVDSLSPKVKEAAQAAALLGGEFDPVVLEKLVAGGDSFQAILDAGTEAGLWAPSDDGYYRFTQDLVREAMEQMQLASTAKHLHSRAAALLEQLHPNDPSLNADLAYHYVRADMRDKACDALRRAADYAIANFKNEKALEFLEKLQEYEQRVPERIAAYKDIASVYELTGRWKEAADTLVYAVGLSVVSVDLAVRGRLLTNLGEIYRKQSETATAIKILTQARQLAEKVGDKATYAEALIHLGQSQWSQGDYGAALALFDEALSTATEIDDLRLEALALYYQGVVYRDQNRYDEADANFRRAYDLFDQIGDDRLSTYPLYDLGVVRLYQGEIEEAKEYFERALAVYRRIGYQSGSSAATLNLGVLRDRRGDFAGAIRYYEEARKMAEQINEQMAIGYTLFSIGATYYKMGDNRKSLAYLKDSFASLKRLGAKGYYGYVLSYLVSLLARTGNVEKAIRTAYQHTYVVSHVGSDPENGRAVMSVGTALEKGGTLSAVARKRIDYIAEYYNIPKLSPGAFYQKAIEISDPPKYVDTLIPAHFRYAEYLRAQGDEAGFEEHLKRAFELAVDAHWDRFVRKTREGYGEILASLGVNTEVETESPTA